MFTSASLLDPVARFETLSVFLLMPSSSPSSISVTWSSYLRVWMTVSISITPLSALASWVLNRISSERIVENSYCILTMNFRTRKLEQKILNGSIILNSTLNIIMTVFRNWYFGLSPYQNLTFSYQNVSIPGYSYNLIGLFSMDIFMIEFLFGTFTEIMNITFHRDRSMIQILQIYCNVFNRGLKKRLFFNNIT